MTHVPMLSCLLPLSRNGGKCSLCDEKAEYELMTIVSPQSDVPTIHTFTCEKCGLKVINSPYYSYQQQSEEEVEGGGVVKNTTLLLLLLGANIVFRRIGADGRPSSGWYILNNKKEKKNNSRRRNMRKKKEEEKKNEEECKCVNRFRAYLDEMAYRPDALIDFRCEKCKTRYYVKKVRNNLGRL